MYVCKISLYMYDIMEKQNTAKCPMWLVWFGLMAYQQFVGYLMPM